MAAAVCADVQRASHLWRGTGELARRRGSPCSAVSAGDIATFLTRNLGFLDSSELTNFGILAHQAHRNMIRSIMHGFRGVAVGVHIRIRTRTRPVRPSLRFPPFQGRLTRFVSHSQVDVDRISRLGHTWTISSSDPPSGPVLMGFEPIPVLMMMGSY